MLRGSLAFSLGVANRSAGDFEAAEQAFTAASETASTEDNLLSAVIASYDLGELLADRHTCAGCRNSSIAEPTHS